MKYVRRVRNKVEDRGASAVEYGLMVAAIAAMIVAVVFGLGTLVKDAFSQTCSSFASGASIDGATPGCDGTTTGGTGGDTAGGTTDPPADNPPVDNPPPPG